MDDRLAARKLFIKHNFSRQSPHHEQSRRHETFAFSGLVCVCVFCVFCEYAMDKPQAGPNRHNTGHDRVGGHVQTLF